MLRIRRDGRVAEGARLESVYTVSPYRGFESLSLRQFLSAELFSRLFLLALAGVKTPVLMSFDPAAQDPSVALSQVFERLSGRCCKQSPNLQQFYWWWNKDSQPNAATGPQELGNHCLQKT